MKNIISKIILPIVTFFVGLVVGVTLFYVFGKDYLLMMTGLQPVKHIIWESEEANEPYRSGKRDVARYALEHNAKILEYYSKDKEIDSWGASADLAFTYARLAKLAEADGDQKSADALFNKAAETYTRRMKSGTCSPEKIRKMVDKLDSVQSERTFPSFASIFENKATPNRPVEQSR
jgi:hypothetical protein